jgi:hypothetical protein
MVQMSRLPLIGRTGGLGTTMILDGIVEPMELAHLPYEKAPYEDYIGLARNRRVPVNECH